MADNIYDVMPSSMLISQIDKRFMTNGHPYVFVDGTQIAGARNPRYEPGQPALNPFSTDARTPPEVELRSFGDYGQITMAVGTEQASAMTRVLGMGACLRTKTEINGDRVLGKAANLPATVPATVNDAWFAVIKITGTTSNQTFTIPRLPVTDIDPTSGKMLICGYKAGAWKAITGTSFDTGVITVSDWFIGTIVVTSVGLYTPLVYDPATVYTVTLGGDTIAVDYVDPNLQSGDDYILIAITAQFGQLANAGDYSIVQPYEAIQPCAIDMIECLGDAPGGKLWCHRRWFHCEQVNMPGYAPSATDGAARETEFRWRVKPYTGRFAAHSATSVTGGGGGVMPTIASGDGGASYFMETDYIVLP